MPSTVTWFSAMASSSADWVFGEARLISSPSTMDAKTGPGRNSNTSAERFQTVTPTTSEGSRSGVNWIRPNSQSTEAARALARVVLPTPGHVLEQQVALGDQAEHRQLDHVGLALDGSSDGGGDGAVQLGEGGRPWLDLLGGHPVLLSTTLGRGWSTRPFRLRGPKRFGTVGTRDRCPRPRRRHRGHQARGGTRRPGRNGAASGPSGHPCPGGRRRRVRDPRAG